MCRTEVLFSNSFYLCLECQRRLKKWIDVDNELKIRIADIQQKCAQFEYKLIPKIKDATRAYAAISQTEFQTMGDAFADFSRMSCSI